MQGGAAFDAYRVNSRFGSLDGLRALSVAAVIWTHTGGGLATSSWAQQGQQGVTLFFAISGFLITMLMLREKERHGSIDLRAFYIRRCLRIFPLYYAVLLVYVLLVFLLERDSRVGQEFFANLKYFASYTSNWFVALDGRTIFYFSWSLAAEEQFYLVWPPLMKRLGTRSRALALIGALVAGLALLEWFLPDFVGAERARPVQELLRTKVPVAILAGVAAALLLHGRDGYLRCWPWLAGTRWHSAAWLVAALALNLFATSLPWVTGHLVCAGLVASCCMREDHVLARLLQWRPLAYAGTISYGLYLLHMLCKNALVKAVGLAGVTPELLGPGGLFAGTLLLSLVVAGASFRWFETPFLRMKGRFDRSAPAVLRTVT
jgi:peptidoglycan/LPS O-acetylase OafA/YrhL